LTLITSLLPASEDRGDKASLEVSIEHLGEEIDIGNEGTHENNRHIGGIEEPDWVRSIRGCFIIGQFQRNLEPLEVDNDKEHKRRSKNIANVRQRISEDSIIDSSKLIVPEEYSIDKLNKGSLILFDISGS
jgi:hypothetical protein